MKHGYRKEDVTNQRWKLTVILIVFYLWWYVTTPEFSPKLEFLATIRFERVLAISLLAIILLTGKLKFRGSPLTPLIILFFMATLVSYLISPYSWFANAGHWFENYWKIVLFYFMVLYGTDDTDDLHRIFLAFAVITFVYQLHSWADFIHGGSYVYQQGFKRIVGVWSGGGFGAPNAFGLLGVFSVPFSVYLLKTDKGRYTRWMAISLLAISLASIIFSGTRGALLTLLALVGIYYRHKIMHPKRLLAIGIVIAIAVVAMPQELMHRYFDQIIVKNADIDSRTDEIAADSAAARIDGLVDGWKLFLMRPILGFGPGTSSAARLKVHEIRDSNGDLMYHALHNLYGELISETGLIGSSIFISLILIYFVQLRKIIAQNGESERAHIMHGQAELLVYLMLSMLIYGMVSHTLYRYTWFFLFGCQAILVYSARSGNHQPKHENARAGTHLKHRKGDMMTGRAAAGNPPR